MGFTLKVMCYCFVAIGFGAPAHTMVNRDMQTYRDGGSTIRENANECD